MASFVFVFFATPFILGFLPTSNPGRLHLSLPEPRPIHPPEEPVSLNTDRSAARATYLFSSFYHTSTPFGFLHNFLAMPPPTVSLWRAVVQERHASATEGLFGSLLS